MRKILKFEEITISDTGDIIDVEMFTISEKIPPKTGHRYKFKVDDVLLVSNHPEVTGIEILEAACKVPPDCFTLYQKFKHHEYKKVGLDEVIDLSKPGIEYFITKPPEVFHYTIDDEAETTDQKELTPNQILEHADIKPITDYYLVQIEPDGKQISYLGKADKLIKMKCPGLKFVSVFSGETPVS